MPKLKKHGGFYAILVGVVAAFFYIYEYAVRVMPSVMTRDLMHAFNIGAPGLGILSSIFFYAYAPMQIPAGMLYDRLGPRLLLTVMITLCSVATALFGFAVHYEVGLMMRFICGFTAAFAYLGALKIGSNWYNAKHFAMYAGLVQFFGCVGAISGQIPIEIAQSHLGWRHTAELIAVIGLSFALIMWFVLRDCPEHTSGIMYHNKKKHHRSVSWKVFYKSQNWSAALFGFFIWAPATVFGELWGIPFLRNALHITELQATFFNAMIWTGIAIGGPVIGSISSHWWHNRRYPMMLCAAIGIVTSIAMIYLTYYLPDWLLATCLFFFGAACSAMVLSFGLASDNNPPHAIGTISGLTNMAIILSGVVLQPTVGFILQAFWTGKFFKNIPIYSVHAYRYGLMMIPICFTLALCTAFSLIKETHAKKSF